MSKLLRGCRGITLIELMTLTVIIGIVASLAAPRFMKAIERMNLRSASRDITSSFRLARSMAISEKIPHGVYFDDQALRIVIFKDVVSPGTMAFDVGDQVISADTLPYACEYVTSDVTTHAVIFQSNGSAGFVGGGNFYTVASTENVIGISHHNILAATGRVSSSDYFY